MANNKIIKIGVGVFLFFILSSCKQAHEKKSANTQLSDSTITAQEGAQIKTIKVIPITEVIRHTSTVGTVEHPTIDGGILNAVDGIPVVESSEKDKTTFSVSKNNQPQIFSDNWAKSEKVKEFLSKATEDGKLAYVLEKIDEQKLPASLAIVPMVESEYNNEAISKKGAVGAWQLMPETAKQEGLSEGDRRQFELATKAALNLLKHLYQQFNNWELVFAAYNSGASRVQKALQKNPRAQTINDLDLPAETKNYVARIMILNEAISELK